MSKIRSFFYNYRDDVNAMAAVEAALLFPTLITMLVSMVDIGNGLLSNQKLISAAQTTADLITRESNPSYEQRDEAILAGQISMWPYSVDTYEYNMTSFEFDDDGSAEIVWEESSGLSMDGDITADLDDLGSPGEGVVVVVTRYVYQPFFTGFIIGPIEMQEVAYLRGRKSPVVGLPS
jgi:Flp pilus assembly protein TadG